MQHWRQGLNLPDKAPPKTAGGGNLMQPQAYIRLRMSPYNYTVFYSIAFSALNQRSDLRKKVASLVQLFQKIKRLTCYGVSASSSASSGTRVISSTSVSLPSDTVKGPAGEAPSAAESNP